MPTTFFSSAESPEHRSLWLWDAVNRDSLPMLQGRLKNGKPLEERRADGGTALMLACQKRRWDMAEALLDAGVNANAQDRRGWTAAHHAVAGAMAARDPDGAKMAVDFFRARAVDLSLVAQVDGEPLSVEAMLARALEGVAQTERARGPKMSPRGL